MIDLNLQKTGAKECAGRKQGKNSRVACVRQWDVSILGKNATEKCEETGTQTDNTGCSADLPGMYSKLLEKTEKIVTLEGELTNLWRRWNDVQVCNVMLQQENTAFQQSANLHDSNSTELRAKLTSLESRLAHQTELNTELESQSAQLRSDMEAVHASLQSCTAENKALQSSLSDSQSTNALLSSQLRALQTELSDVRRESDSRKFLREEMTSMIAEHDAVEKKLFDLQQSLEKRDAAIKDLRLEAKRREMEVKDLKAAVLLQAKRWEGGKEGSLV